MLTETQIKSAIKATTTERQLNDGAGGRGTGSLVLVIRRTGLATSALWFGKWKASGKPQKLALGRYPDVSLKDARQKYERDVRDVLAGGGNPRTAARTADAPTVERLFRAYVDSMKAGGAASWPEVERALITGKFNAADGLGKDALAGDVTGGDVSALLAKTFKRGSRTMADRLRAYLSAAFNWAAKAANDYTSRERQDWGVKVNPVATVPRDVAANTTRERNLTADELRQVWHGIGGEGFAPETTAAVRLLICCGQRARETLRVDGIELQLDAPLWAMPAAKTKGGKRPHTLPLPDLAVGIMRELVRVHGDGPLFPSRDGSKGDRLTDGGVSRALRRLVVEKEMKPFQLRDLRRTWKSRAGDAGVDRFTRDLIQQHAQGDTGSKHYDRTDYLPQMRTAMDKWNAWLVAALSDKRQDEAVAA